MAKIVITPGETALIAALLEKSAAVITENLLVGDCHIRDKNGAPVYIFERKAKGDLDASIKDGRYREQKTRLLQTGLPRKNIIYIIEAMSRPKDAAAHKRIWSAICNTTHRDGFSVFQTIGVDQTADYLIGMAASVEQFIACSTDAATVAPVDVNIKKTAVGVGELFKYSLTLINKVSIGLAETIVAEYSTCAALQAAFEENGPECLAELRFGATQRRIGKKLSVEIYEHFSHF